MVSAQKVLGLAIHAADNLAREHGPVPQSLQSHDDKCDRILALWGRFLVDAGGAAGLRDLMLRWKRSVADPVRALHRSDEAVDLRQLHDLGREAFEICFRLEARIREMTQTR